MQTIDYTFVIHLLTLMELKKKAFLIGDSHVLFQYLWMTMKNGVLDTFRMKCINAIQIEVRPSMHLT